MELWVDLGGGEEGTALSGLWMVLGGGEVTRELRWLLGVHAAPGDLSVLLRRRDKLGVQGVGLLGLLNCGATGDSSLACGVIPAFLVEKVGLGACMTDRGEVIRSGAKPDTGVVTALLTDSRGIMGGEKQYADL